MESNISQRLFLFEDFLEEQMLEISHYAKSPIWV